MKNKISQKPNILLITTDQQHYSMLGAVNDILKTPNLDSLAEEGIRFNRTYCANPTCSPSRASIITGMYPSCHGCWSLGTKLPESVHTLGEYLKNNGYHTALVGKAHFQPTRSTDDYSSFETPEYMWDIDFWRNFNNDFYGFEKIALLSNHTAEHWVGQHYVAWLEDNGCKNWKKYFFKPRGKMHNKYMGRWKIPEEYHYNNFIAETSNKLIEEYAKKDEPFFLWSSFPDPHYPQLVPKPWDKMYDYRDMELPEFSYEEHEKNPPYFKEVLKKKPNLDEYRESGYAIHGFERNYYNKKRLKKQLAYSYGMMSFTDKYIGKILDKIKALNLDDNTLIIFTTDHGDLFGQHGLMHKCIFHYEDLLRVPMIVKYKNHIPENTVSDSLQSLVDIAPTILDYCSLPIGDGMQGVSQKNVWNGEVDSARDFVICENRHEPHTLHMVSFVTDNFKITVHEGRTYGELYDLKNDEGEHYNLWDEPQIKDIKFDLLCRFLIAEIQLDKNFEFCFEKDNIKLIVTSDGGFKFTVDNINVTENNDFKDEKINILIFAIGNVIGKRKMPMPRIANS